MIMKLLNQKDLQPLFAGRPEQKAYTLKRYFHPWQKFFYLHRLKMTRRLLDKKYRRLLEIGFGSGIFIPELTGITEDYHGVDIHPEVKLVGEILNNKKIKANLKKADIYSLPYPDEYFDAVVCLSVLEFITNLERAVSEIQRVAKPEADIILGAPILNPLTNFIYDKIVKFKNHRQAHRSNHHEIIKALEGKLKIEKIITSPRFLPLNYSLFFVLKAKKY